MNWIDRLRLATVTLSWPWLKNHGIGLFRRWNRVRPRRLKLHNLAFAVAMSISKY
ncbi:hypothetical protein FA15DRAFT_321623 [Coprinopsis marcescibilis]|uniref:Uncharacterized protein n=1 Tax=Coprinopsis marcescibilis TaxID=230819 RepID=A0A5C3L089_COPMA|nr:hypothetical protein FA15DRAFT_321623 [Coprinopsis marcescibilis]